MRNITWIAVAVLSSGLVAGSADAATFASNMGGCNHAASAVKDAVAANAQSANLAQAQQEQGYGREFCNNQLYDRGVMHYQKALDLLGAHS
jgi:hydroxyethylthiazole kinase-like sugar kinase family protein